jgi:hypothetical protein
MKVRVNGQLVNVNTNLVTSRDLNSVDAKPFSILSMSGIQSVNCILDCIAKVWLGSSLLKKSMQERPHKYLGQKLVNHQHRKLLTTKN